MMKGSQNVASFQDMDYMHVYGLYLDLENYLKERARFNK